MRIRKIRTRQVKGKTYSTHRLVPSVRIGDQVEQVYLLNLGARFDVSEADWKTLCWCILERLRGQQLLPPVPDAIRAEAEELVQRLVTRQRERLIQARLIEPDTCPAQWMAVDIANQTQHDSRTAGVEQVGLWALRQVGFVALLSRLGFSASLRRAAVGAIMGRMAHPASDRETHRWLREDSALGEYLGTDYAPSTVQQLYRGAEPNVTWLKEKDRRYIVVSRERTRAFDAEKAKSIPTRSGQELQLHEVKGEDETRVYCRSKARVQKEEAIVKRRMARFEGNLKKLSEGLTRPRTRKKLTYIHERIGRLKQSSGGVAQHYAITVQADDKGTDATKIDWTLDPKANTMLTPEELWRTYIMLTDVEAVFRSLKSELGLRPVFHRKRTTLFITVLAYQMVQLIRHQLRQKAELHYSWATLRNLLATQVRSTRVLPCQDGSTLHSQLTDTPNPVQAKILQALEIRNCPLGIRNTIVR